EGATVVEVGAVDFQPGKEQSNTTDLVRSALRRSWSTDSRGAAYLHPIKGRVRVWATTSTLQSETWEGEATGQISLSLRECFTAGGTVLLPNGMGLPADTTVRCGIRRGMDFIDLGLATVSPSASWG